jgi:hypothetical protein
MTNRNTIQKAKAKECVFRAPVVAKVVEVVVVKEEVPDFDIMTKKALFDYCEQKGIEVDQSLSRAKLLEFLRS